VVEVCLTWRPTLSVLLVWYSVAAQVAINIAFVMLTEAVGIAAPRLLDRVLELATACRTALAYLVVYSLRGRDKYMLV
jgi:multisubunit Na+/H+ antiporter MnhF subunit